MKARDETHIHVLLVEDDPEVGKTLKLILERQDMTVTLASNGEQALGLLSDEALSELDPDAFDVLITDVRMEGMSGTDLLKHVRAKAPDLPVILITGYDDFHSVVDAVKYDAQDFVFKRPSSIESIAVPVKKAVHNYRLLLRNRALARDLERSEARFRDLAAMLPEFVWETDGNGRLTFMNRAGLDKFGRLPEDVEKGIQLADCLIPADADRVWHVLERALQGEMTQSLRLTGIGSGGAPFPLLVSAVPIVQEGRCVGVRGIAVDITAIRNTEEELRAHQARLRTLVNELTLAEEKERRRIAVDLHESIAQLLALSKDQLSTLTQKLSADDPELRAMLNGLRAMVARALDQARSLTHQLCPPTLYELGLDKALAELVQNTRSLHDLMIDLKVEPPLPVLENNRKVFLYRAAQELLGNVVNHARARRAAVTLAGSGGEVRLTVADDGEGFETEARIKAGIGLLSIRERIEAIGGTFAVESTPGKGTTVTLRVPAG